MPFTLLVQKVTLKRNQKQTGKLENMVSGLIAILLLI